MDIERRIGEARNLTPTEQQLAATVRSLGERIQSCTIKEFAQAGNASIPSVHRFCKKLGLEGFKELKVEMARAAARHAGRPGEVDINFPFGAGDRAQTVLGQMASVYDTTLHDTRGLLDPQAIDRAAELLRAASVVDLYTQSHNLYPAQMFCDRLLSCGKTATCFEQGERQMRTALASGDDHVAIMISYSGLGSVLASLTPTLKRRGTPIILIGTPRAQRLNPGLDVYLHVSDRESLQNRITQFASHIAVQYVLDTLFGCLFAADYERNLDFLRQSLPYTLRPEPRMTPEEYAGFMLSHTR